MIVDLNESGASPFGPAREHVKPQALAELINPYIDAALEKTRAEQPKRLYLGASELGEPCKRKVILGALDAVRTPLTGRKLRIFEMGHKFEDMVADWLKRAGFWVHTIDPQTGKQFEFQTALDSNGHGRIQGHIDGVIDGGPRIPELPDYPWVWENKALMAKYWNAIVKKGVQIAEPKYYYQLQMYLGYFQIKVGLFTCINKDTAEIYHEIVPYVLQSAQRISDRGVELIQMLDRGEMPKRISKNRDYYLCRMCDFAESCWSMPE